MKNLPLLKLQIHRAALFDVVVLGLLGWILLDRFWSSKIHPRRCGWSGSKVTITRVLRDADQDALAVAGKQRETHAN